MKLLFTESIPKRKRLALKARLVCSLLTKSIVSTSISAPSGMHCLTSLVLPSPSKIIFLVNTQDRPAWQLQSPSYNKNTWQSRTHCLEVKIIPGEGRFSIYGLYKFLSRDRVWFLRLSVLKRVTFCTTRFFFFS